MRTCLNKTNTKPKLLKWIFTILIVLDFHFLFNENILNESVCSHVAGIKYNIGNLFALSGDDIFNNINV